jgi:benzoate membrane transport protein
MSPQRPAAASAYAFWRNLSATHAGNAIVAFLFAATGPLAVVLATGTKGGLSEAELASWVFGAFFLNGILSIVYCLAYRQPLVFFWTIPGTVLVGPALTHLSFAEVIGAFLATGVLMIALGLTGWVRRAMEAIPMPIVMGMVAGVFLSFGLDWVRALESSVWIAAPMTVAFLLVSLSPALSARTPPLIAALAVGATAIWLQGAFAPGLDLSSVVATPQVRAPVFSWAAMLELVVPLAITVLVVQNGQGLAVLTAAEHAPPVNSIAVACGVGTVACGMVGAAPTCLTGPVNAIISSAGARDTQYAAGVVVGIIALVFGLLSPLFTRLLLAAPAAFIATLAGLAMLRVLQGAFVIAFRGTFTLGALATFLVTVAGMPILNIGAPFWALIAGSLVSLMLERQDWAACAPTQR